MSTEPSPRTSVDVGGPGRGQEADQVTRDDVLGRLAAAVGSVTVAHPVRVALDGAARGRQDHARRRAGRRPTRAGPPRRSGDDRRLPRSHGHGAIAAVSTRPKAATSTPRTVMPSSGSFSTRSGRTGIGASSTRSTTRTTECCAVPGGRDSLCRHRPAVRRRLPACARSWSSGGTSGSSSRPSLERTVARAAIRERRAVLCRRGRTTLARAVHPGPGAVRHEGAPDRSRRHHRAQRRSRAAGLGARTH